MKFIWRLCVICFCLLPIVSSTQTTPSTDAANILWYREPATTWNEALPIGNGRLGAMVFGGVPAERIQLNEDTVWAGEKRDRNNPEGAKNLAFPCRTRWVYRMCLG